MARHEGMSSQRAHLDRLLACISVEVMRRASQMVRDCLPRATSVDGEVDHEEGAAASADPSPLDPAFELRAGHPCTVDLPLFS